MQSQIANNGTTITLMMNFVGVDDTAINIASVASISRQFITAPGVLSSPVSLTPSAVVFDTPRTDNGWTGSPGYNFRDRFVAAAGVTAVVYTVIDSAENPIVETQPLAVATIP